MAFMRNPPSGRDGRGVRGRRGGRGERGGRSSSRGGQGGPTLPSTLMAEVDAAYGGISGRKTFDGSRKGRRKVEREEKRRPSSQRRPRPPVEDDDALSPPVDTAQVVPSIKRSDKLAEVLGRERAAALTKKRKRLPGLALPSAGNDDAEDEEIEWLEWVLKKERTKAKGKTKAVDDDGMELADGLDELLELADVVGPGGPGLRRAAGEQDESAEEHEDERVETRNEEDSGSASESGEGRKGHSESPSANDEDDAGEKDGRSRSGASNAASSSSSSHHSLPAPATAPARYIPPQLRAAQLEERSRGNKQKAEKRMRLEGKAQGLLNKLSEANLESTLREIEELYRGHSRNDISTILTSLIIRTISSRSNLLDSFVVLYATLVGALHRVIGMEFGAHLVHTLVMRYNALTTISTPSTPLSATIYETPDASKEGLNLLVLIAELYNAGVVSSKLVYDLVRGFLRSGDEEEMMDEREVEGLLKILRCCGSQLRSDDPASLKDIIRLAQEKTKGREQTMTSRARFLVETLTNVKNNKLRSASGTEQGHEAAERMKKFLSSLGRSRRLLATEPLRVGLIDLLDADTKGKWWLVGAGWSGDPLMDRKGQRSATKPRGDVHYETEEKLLEVARAQGMNTDVRRSIFVVLMTSEDFMHACDRLSHLRLTEKQQREFIRVTLRCASLEKTYNPYYTLILNRLCSESYDHRFTLQYALWDFLRTLDDGSGSKDSKKRSGNIARAVAFIVPRGSLDLTVFKGVEWTSLTRSTMSFLLTFLIHLILATQSSSPLFVLPKHLSSETMDEESVEEIFDKTLGKSELAQGWLVLLQGVSEAKVEKAMEGMGKGRREGEVVRRGLGIAREVLGWVG